MAASKLSEETEGRCERETVLLRSVALTLNYVKFLHNH